MNIEEMISDKQKEYMLFLIRERLAKNGEPLEKELMKRHGNIEAYVSGLTKAEASDFISRMVALKKAPALSVGAPVVIPEGLYELRGEIIRVIKSGTSGKPYVKVIRTNAEGKQVFAYAGQNWTESNGHRAHISELAGRPMLTVDEVRALSLQVGFCAVCGRELTDKQSIDRSIGPVCEKRYSAKVAAHQPVAQAPINPAVQAVLAHKGRGRRAQVIDANHPAATPPRNAKMGGPY